jgi:hypothetical protein
MLRDEQHVIRRGHPLCCALSRRNQRMGDCQMQIIKLLAALGALSFTALVNAQGYLECGTAACSPSVNPWSYAVAGATGAGAITGINDLNVGGDLFDVTFATTAPASSPFVFSSATAAPGQPLTGVDAGAAIADFFGSIAYPSQAYGGFDYVGDLGSAYITAFAPAGALSSEYFGATELFDVAETHVGIVDSSVPAGTVLQANAASFDHQVLEVGALQSGYYTSNEQGVQTDNGGIYYTKWTRIAAPEIDPVSAMSAMTLLFCGLAVLRGRRPGQRAA